MEKNLFIIHGYNGDTTETFGLYVENEAKKLGFTVFMPSFPIKQDAKYEAWKEIMDKYLEKGYINENTVIIAHSLGTIFIPRYLAEKNAHICLYISLAGFLEDHSGREDLGAVVKGFLPTEKQIDKAIELMANRFSIYSNNDHLNPQEELEKYADRFNAKKIFIPNIGHMGRKSGIKEIPKIIDIIRETIIS